MRQPEREHETGENRLAAQAMENPALSTLIVFAILFTCSVLLQAKEPDTGIPREGQPPHEEGQPQEEAPTAEESNKTPGDWLPGEFSGTAALTSNYMSRGISQTDNNPAAQVYLEYALEMGLLGTSVYLSTFGSNTKLVGDRSTGHFELDAFFGVRGQIGETRAKWDLGGAYYSYPGLSERDNFNYWEIPLIVTYDPVEWLEVQVSNSAAPEYQFDGGIGNYTNGLITVTLPNPYVGLSRCRLSVRGERIGKRNRLDSGDDCQHQRHRFYPSLHGHELSASGAGLRRQESVRCEGSLYRRDPILIGCAA